MECLRCTSTIEKHDQYYIAGEMGPDIVAVFEQNDVKLVDENGVVCSDCFDNIVRALSNNSGYDEVQHLTNICICCQLSLTSRRCHSVTEGPEKYIISKRLYPRKIPESALVCFRCWTHAQKTLKEQGIPFVPSSNTYVCVWCCRSLANTRRHTIPEGPERNEIIARIYPREIPLGGSVCYACWVTACRNVQKAKRQKDPDAGPAHLHYGEVCVWCCTSLFRRQVRILHKGPERDVVAAKIYPRELPEHPLLCVNCWARIQQPANIAQPIIQNQTMCLDGEFKHTPNTSDRCFVPGCTNTERLCVPHHIRKRILVSQNIFVTDNSRICAEHKMVHNWEFLVQHQFSDSFTKAEMKAMLRLSMSQDT